jgi:hypothetical protein
MRTITASIGSLAATAAVAFAAPPAAFADLNLERASRTASSRVEAHARALKAGDERAEWSVRGCHAVDSVEVQCKSHVLITRHGRTRLHRDGIVSVVARGGRYVARFA